MPIWARYPFDRSRKVISTAQTVSLSFRSGTCYLKFATVRSGLAAERHFEKSLKSCEEFAVSKRATRLVAGVNSGRSQAYRGLLSHGFRTEFQGVAMHRGNDAGYNREGVFLIDDWR